MLMREPQVVVKSPGGSREKGVEWRCTHMVKWLKLSPGVATNDSERRENSEKDAVAPCLRVGRGLKPSGGGVVCSCVPCCALPSGGARIETTRSRSPLPIAARVAPC